jgi:histone acetyltransferase (RNA polymerase elongator complex component)
MGKKKQLIIPIFTPFAGCDNRCVFCNQDRITNAEKFPKSEDITLEVEKYLSTWKGGNDSPREVAFYGGTFTALPVEVQTRLLKTAYAFIDKGEIDSLRVSTRPDYIDENIIARLKEYGVRTVELGVQSMNDSVLKASGRVHKAEATVRAVKLLKESDISVGLQLMPGLPLDSEEVFRETVKEAASLKPDFVRIYPTLVIEGTLLADMYRDGSYEPWTLERMVRACSEALKIFESANIKVIRVGLHHTKELEAGIIAGPYAPNFRDLLAV